MTRTFIQRRRGASLLETLLAVGIAAAAVVVATTFALNGLTITADLNAQQDFNAAVRRTQREFFADAAQATRFHFGYVDDEQTTPRTLPPEGPQELTLGYTDALGRDIWVHYSAKASASTGTFFLLKTSNQQDGETYQTTLLAPDVESLRFDFYDIEGEIAQFAGNIRRVDMTLSLASAAVKRQTPFTVVLRVASEGAVPLPPGLDFKSIEDANFLR